MTEHDYYHNLLTATMNTKNHETLFGLVVKVSTDKCIGLQLSNVQLFIVNLQVLTQTCGERPDSKRILEYTNVC